MSPELSRRRFALGAAAALPAAAATRRVWTHPIIQVLETRADATTRGSAKPTPPPREQVNTPEPYTPHAVAVVEPSDARLPFTDTNERGEMAAGTAAVLAGAAAVVLSHEGRGA